jgi:phage terminase large subunit-like protein
MMNEILAYYQAIQDGTVLVGRWVKLFYQYIVNGLEKSSFFFSPKKAKVAIKFIEAFCRHHEGELAPQLIKLELWQRALISVLFGIMDKDGNRQFREAFIVMGRKNGKTLLAAAISCYCAFLDGEYGGRIYFAAPKLKQAGLCYEAFYQMLDKDPSLSKLAKKRRSDIYIPETNTTAEPLAFNAKKSDGLNISLCVADEVASWQGDAGLKMYEVLKSSFGARRQPLLLSISTAGYQNDSTYDELMKRATAVLMGSSKETRFAPILYTIDDVALWNDLNELKKANPNLGVSVSYDYMLEEIAVAEGSLSKRAEFLTKYCNIKQSSSTAWLEFQTVEKCLSERIKPSTLAHHYCVGGVDLSQAIDLTSACVVIEDKGRLYVIQHYWMPHKRLEKAIEEDGVPYRQLIQNGFLSLSGENYVDYNDVFKWFRNLVEQYEILPLQVGYDKWCATYFVDQMTKYGFHMDDVRQGSNLTPVIREVDGLLKDGVVCIGDNTLTQAHFLNSALKQEEDRVRLVKISKRARIDGMAAFLDAMTVRQKHYADIGAQLKNEG